MGSRGRPLVPGGYTEIHHPFPGAEFETNLRRKRQLEGIAKAKAAGVYKGRPASIDATQVRAMKAQGLGASEIAKALKDRPGVGLSGAGSSPLTRPTPRGGFIPISGRAGRQPSRLGRGHEPPLAVQK
jgi:hypothetical protein